MGWSWLRPFLLTFLSEGALALPFLSSFCLSFRGWPGSPPPSCLSFWGGRLPPPQLIVSYWGAGLVAPSFRSSFFGEDGLPLLLPVFPFCGGRHDCPPSFIIVFFLLLFMGSWLPPPLFRSIFTSFFLYAVLSFWGCPGCTPALRSGRVWLSPTFRSFWGGSWLLSPTFLFSWGVWLSPSFMSFFLSGGGGGGGPPPPNHLVCSVWCLS